MVPVSAAKDGLYEEAVVISGDSDLVEPIREANRRDAFDNVWILDVDGVHLLIASGSLGSATEGAVMAEIRQMVESIHFER